MKVTFIGHGYVGLVTAAVFADLGNTVWVLGRTPEKIKRLQSGDPIIFEPGLEEVVKRNIKANRLHFTLSYEDAIPDSDIVFICVGTPPKKTGEADLTSVFDAAEKVAQNLKNYTVVVTKSTVPPGTNRKVGNILDKHAPEGVSYDIASAPEFLREGTGLSDTLRPDRIVLGTDSEKAMKLLLEVHEPIEGKRVTTGVETAEMIKYASNAFLATKISFANALAVVSESVGANIEEVLDGVGMDKRIGRNFLYPGVGYGGSCFPKDVKALIAISKKYGYPFELLQEVEQVNAEAAERFIKKIDHHFASTKAKKAVGVLGLSFKPDTDDMREAPSIVIIEALLQKGFTVQTYDPIAMENAQRILPKSVTFADDAYKAVSGMSAMIVVTEWNEFRQIDLEKVQQSLAEPTVFDGRNIYDPKKMSDMGFTYYSVGRPYRHAAE